MITIDIETGEIVFHEFELGWDSEVYGLAIAPRRYPAEMPDPAVE